jgi:hypothetical protein
MSREIICALCEHFTLQDSPQAAEGIGLCKGYDGHARTEPYFVRWDQPGSVLFGPAPDMGKRLQWISLRKREEGGDVAAA